MKGYGGKCNNTSTMRVKGHREAGEGKVCVEFDEPQKDGGDKKKGDAPVAMDATRSYATICMSKDEASHYPVGSTAKLHCVPVDKKGTKEEGEKKDGWEKFPAFKGQKDEEDYE